MENLYSRQEILDAGCKSIILKEPKKEVEFVSFEEEPEVVRFVQIMIPIFKPDIDPYEIQETARLVPKIPTTESHDSEIPQVASFSKIDENLLSDFGKIGIYGMENFEISLSKGVRAVIFIMLNWHLSVWEKNDILTVLDLNESYNVAVVESIFKTIVLFLNYMKNGQLEIEKEMPVEKLISSNNIIVGGRIDLSVKFQNSKKFILIAEIKKLSTLKSKNSLRQLIAEMMALKEDYDYLLKKEDN